MLEIDYADPNHPEIIALLKQSHALMQLFYSADENHYLSIEELCRPDVRFFGAKLHEIYVGCAALAIRDGYGEMKSLFTSPDHRRQGIAKELVDAVEKETRKHKFYILRLETGALLGGALSLYKKLGFNTCGPFGHYREDPASLFMYKHLNKSHDA